MSFVAVADFDGDGRVTKFAEYTLSGEAQAHVSRISGRYPNAFSDANPGGGWRHWRVVGGALTSDPRAPDPEPTDDEIYDEVIQNRRVLKAVVLALNDGSFVPGANVSNAALKTTIKAKM